MKQWDLIISLSVLYLIILYDRSGKTVFPDRHFSNVHWTARARASEIARSLFMYRNCAQAYVLGYIYAHV